MVVKGELNYTTLVREGREVTLDPSARTLKVALLADCATQHLASLLRTLAARGNFALELYEGDYDAIDLEALNPASGLYAFDPDFVVVLMATEKLKSRIYEAPARDTFVEDSLSRITGIWSAIRAHSSATVVQSTLVLPLERAFGNYEPLVADSLGSLVADINHGIVRAARSTSGVLLADVDFLASTIGRERWNDPALWNMAKVPCRLEYLPRLAQALVDVVLATAGSFVKCVVLDLDNTLWGGVIGDDGLEGIQLGEFDEGEAFVAFQKFLKELKRRGVILAVCSKNEHDNAILPFRQHPFMVLAEEDIAVFVANWDSKAENIRLIQSTLNIGFDSMVFLDDNPFERDVVRTHLPAVVVPDLPEDPSHYLQALAPLNLFETASYSEADAKRAAQYREEAQRTITRTQFESIGEYLASLSMEVVAERFNPFNLPRIAQLIQRSNQFNLATRRYGQAACEALAADPACLPFTLKLSDRFGDYGLISVIVCKHRANDLVIDEYLMSCRVLQRGVEQFAMNLIFAHAARVGAHRVVGTYIPTPKNAMVRGFYESFGFACTAEDADGTTHWALPVADYVPREVLMTSIHNDIALDFHS